MNRWTKLVSYEPAPGDPYAPSSTPLYQNATFIHISIFSHIHLTRHCQCIDQLLLIFSFLLLKPSYFIPLDLFQLLHVRPLRGLGFLSCVVAFLFPFLGHVIELHVARADDGWAAALEFLIFVLPGLRKLVRRNSAKCGVHVEVPLECAGR